MVYRKAREVVALCDKVVRTLPVVRKDLRDQLHRASTSVMFNIAEGADEYSLGDKARFYRIARRSAGECDAVLDAVELRGFARAETRDARALLREIGAMLNAMIQQPPARRQ